MKVTKIKQENCQATYEYDGVKIKFWIITGGQMALAFEDYSFTERFNEWHGYIEGIYENLSGCPHDLSPLVNGNLKGEDVLIDFYDRNIRKLISRKSRVLVVQGLIGNQLKSKRIHDEEDHSYVYNIFDVRSNYIGSVHTSGNNYSHSGCITQSLKKWKFLSNYLESLTIITSTWEDLSPEQFEQLLYLLEAARDAKPPMKRLHHS